MPEPQSQIDLLERLRELERHTELLHRQYRLLSDSLAEAILVHDARGDLISVNAALERLTGYGRQTLLGMNIRRLLSGESCEQVWSRIQEATAEGQFSADAEIITREGTRRSVTLHGTILRERDGLLAVQYFARPAGSRQPSEGGDSETRFRLMAKNLTEMVLAYDMERRLTFANAATETLTGYSVTDLERSQFICWVHPGDRERMLTLWDRLFEGTSFHEEEYRLITKDGRRKWVAASWGPILDDHGKQVGVLGRERDITERHMSEEAQRQSQHSLRESEERYRALFEDSPFPMWEEDFSRVRTYLEGLRAAGVTDIREYLVANREALTACIRKIRILDVNRSARDFYGVQDKEELLGDLNVIFDEPAYEMVAEELATLLETNTQFRAEFQTRTLKGEERSVSMIVSLAPTPNQDWSRVIVTFFDITDRKRLEEQVLQSQKLESLGRLAGGIAHDFNNLLTVINGYSELLLHGLEPENPLRRGLAEIHNAGSRGAELTQQLLAFSRKQIAQFRPLDLKALIRESEGMLHRVIGEDIKLVIHTDPDTGTVKGDRGQLHQVLMNLVVNGREAMPHGGTLTIETSNAHLGPGLEEEPAGPHTRQFVLLRIGDTGVGMDVRTRQHLFEPFFTTKRKTKGTGLGLSTVFGIVTQCGGHISVASEPGHGSVFSVYLPYLAAPVKPDPAVEPPTRRVRRSGAILVVEDQTDVRQLTCTILRGFGYEVLEAANGAEALALATDYAKPIRLLLTDVIMPGLNGRELAARLAATQPGMKVMYMSGYTDRLMGENGIIEDSVVFLQKPFTPDRLMHTVERALGGRAD